MILPFFPVVSIVLPVYNGARFLSSAFETIRVQNYPALEVIVIDDGSTDDSAQIAAHHHDSFPIHFISQPHQGAAAARNQGLTMATGDLITFLDVDDLYPAGKLHLQVERLNRQPDLDIVSGHTKPLMTIGADDQNLFTNEEAVAAFNLGAAVFRREVFARVGAFDEGLRFSEDVDWFIRALEHGCKIAIMQAVTLYYRQHNSNITRELDQARQKKIMLMLLQRSLKRRRGHDGHIRPIPEWLSLIDDLPATPP